MTESNISQRACQAAEGAKSAVWDVLLDVWNPTTNPNGYTNLGVAENMLMHDQLLEYINTRLALPAKYLTYNDGPTGSDRLRRAIAAFLNKYFRPADPVVPGHLAVTNGVSSAIEHVSWAFADPGEGILLGRPYYGAFVPDMSLRPGTAVIPVEFQGCDPFSLEAVDRYEQALIDFRHKTGRRARALMLCHPHNPLGRCYPHETLLQRPPVPFESALSIDTTGIIDQSLVHGLWGMSKDFGANGLRLGVIVSQHNPELHMALKGVTLYSYSSSVSDHLVSIILEDFNFTDWYIQRNQQKLSESYAFAVERLRSYCIEYAAGGNAGFFLWVNLGRKYRELHPGEPEDSGSDVSEKVMQALLQKKVFVASGSLFGSEHSGWFRIVFSQQRDYLEEALRRIMLALE